MSQEELRVKTSATPRDEGVFMQGVKDCIPTLLGYLSIGFAAGVLEKTAGMSIMEIILLSVLVYAGSAQFIAAGMIATGSSPTAIVITIFFVNLRHILLSAALSPYFRNLTPFKNMLVGSLLTDETFGVAIHEAAKRKQIHEKWMHGLNLTAYLNWIIANIAGAYLGQWISDPEKYGLDFALPAMFIGLLILAIVSRKKVKLDIIVAVCAIVIAVAVAIVYPGNVGVIIATVVASTIGMVIDKWK